VSEGSLESLSGDARSSTASIPVEQPLNDTASTLFKAPSNSLLTIAPSTPGDDAKVLLNVA
jgi:hypothetical protein